MATNTLKPVPPPALPYAPQEYAAQHFRESDNILRLYFNRTAAVSNTLTGTVGGRFLEAPYAQFIDTTTQTAAAATATRLTFNTVSYALGFAATPTPGQGVVVTYPGMYNVQFSLQCANDSVAIDDLTVWFRINNVDVPYTASRAAITEKHGGITGYLIVAANFVFRLQAGDTVSMWWHNVAGAAFLTTFPVGTSPVHPASPAAVLTLQYMSAI